MSSKILPNENEGVQGKFASVFFVFLNQIRERISGMVDESQINKGGV